jgi:lipopolysaccharide/colanic/teichoic acid biosynthesis glycosyltransferase
VPSKPDVRALLGFDEDCEVIGFVGRLVPDKGIVELVRAWEALRGEFPRLRLLLVGPFEDHDALPADVHALLHRDERVRLTGEVSDPALFYKAMDVCVLPTYREGFPIFPLEAAAMELPIVATRVAGCVDAVIDGWTGTLVPPRDAKALADALRAYLQSPELRQQHGQAARRRVLSDFRPEAMWKAIGDEYLHLLQQQGIQIDRDSSIQRSFYNRVGKRACDAMGALILAILLAPVMAAIAVLVRARLGSPAIFCQRRPGLDGREFTLYKFRTMTMERDRAGKLLPDHQRLTRFGKWLRSTSLDELPELFNVLNGTMSLVGPRPLLCKYLSLYSSEQARRHEVRPGLTGVAQVLGRNALSWHKKFRLDVWYVDNMSWLLDLSILVRTIACVVRRVGISARDHATVEEFTGNGVQHDSHSNCRRGGFRAGTVCLDANTHG